MKERGSDREKGSAKSCQPEIKQAGTLPIPEPLHPPQSHILPLHSLYLSATASIFRLFRLSLPLPWQRDIFKSVAALRSRSSLLPHTHRHTCVIRHASDQRPARPRGAEALRTLLLASDPGFAPRLCLCVYPAALEGKTLQLREQHTQVFWHSGLFSAKELSVFGQRPVCLWHCRPKIQLSELLEL